MTTEEEEFEAWALATTPNQLTTYDAFVAGWAAANRQQPETGKLAAFLVGRWPSGGGGSTIDVAIQRIEQLSAENAKLRETISNQLGMLNALAGWLAAAEATERVGEATVSESPKLGQDAMDVLRQWFTAEVDREKERARKEDAKLDQDAMDALRHGSAFQAGRSAFPLGMAKAYWEGSAEAEQEQGNAHMREGRRRRLRHAVAIQRLIDEVGLEAVQRVNGGVAFMAAEGIRAWYCCADATVCARAYAHTHHRREIEFDGVAPGGIKRLTFEWEAIEK